MKISSQEEYGIRILIRIGDSHNMDGLTIPQISETEGLSQHYVAKLCRILRLAGFIKSTRGKEGGYTLAKSTTDISVLEILYALGGKLFSPDFCEHHSGMLENCRHAGICSVRFVWQLVQNSVDQVLNGISLHNLIEFENGRKSSLTQFDEKRPLPLE
jgi:Rrf2 family iron-sulfur cluster assembly transcriptional regulator